MVFSNNTVQYCTVAVKGAMENSKELLVIKVGGSGIQHFLS